METGTVVSLIKKEWLNSCWDDYASLLEVALTESENLLSDEIVINSLLGGAWDLWDVSENGHTVGVFVTELIDVQQGTDINVVLAGFHKNFKALHRALKELIRIAGEAGFHAVRFISKDDRWAALAKRHGMRRRFIEYVKEL